ncbi:major histocompatibility complex class I-related gene protein-like [Rhinatrema bivittatum]|uniref:major histocompatibility complex class I-related gene protein-like n=1 Tax=Rhinatrema bivittatum TaxID=194408 RepID=UPI001127F7A7|nr:major histocompatibility complex class I-related gene protein-like [Rhinatrema bivittatum]
MAENEGPQYWEKATQTLRSSQQGFKMSLLARMDYFNQSGGVHTFQLVCGCELESDGSTQDFWHYGYDGHNFVSLDKERVAWVADVPEGENAAQKWNRDPSFAARQKLYLEQTCIEWLQKYIGYGEQELDRKDRPQVKLWDKKSEGVWTTLYCLVTGFYPREIEVKWVKNGQVTMQGTVTTGILPNHDGTYQIQVSVDIDPQEEATYDCHVDHSSLQEPLRVLWEPKASPIGIIVGAIVVVLLVMAGVLGVVTWKKKRQASDRKDESFSSSGDSSMSI